MADAAPVERKAGPITTFDPKTRVFSVIAATTYPVTRSSYDVRVQEVLEMQPTSVRLGRFKSGRAPILDNHRAGSIADQIGVVTDARIENSQLVVEGRLSSRSDERMKQIVADLAAGIVRNVSVGYAVYASKESLAQDGESITVTRTDWEPVELSIVAIPADPNTCIRKSEGLNMPTTNVLDHDSSIGANTYSNAMPASEKRIMSDADARTAYTLAAMAGHTAEYARGYIDGGDTLIEFRSRLFNDAVAQQRRTAGSSVSERGNETFSNPDFLARSIEDALYARMTGTEPKGAAAELVGRSLLDLGAMVLQSRGERVSWASRDRLASAILSRASSGAHSTSDFPILLTGAGNRVLMEAYRAAECPLKRVARRRDGADFRVISLVKLSEAPRLQEIGESGEITHGSRSEAKEGFRLKTFARIFSISRNAIVNDDLGVFADSSLAWGRAAAETEADELIALFTANSGDGIKLDDGSALYTTSRKNKASSGTAIDIANLGKARQAMREAKGLDGKTPISASPKHLVVGPAKETEAEQVLASIAAAQVSNANPFSGKLTLHVEPRFAGNAWRLFADPMEVPSLVIGYLNGQSGPILDTREGWSTLGAEFRAVLDFGCGLTDWRGTYLNPGDA